MRAVIDTNVIVSALLKPSSNPARLVALALDRRLDFFVSPQLIAEYREVLARPKFGFDAQDAQIFVASLASAGKTINPMPQALLADDEKDQMVLDLAVETDSVLITGNLRHFSEYEKAVLPAEALKMMA